MREFYKPGVDDESDSDSDYLDYRDINVVDEAILSPSTSDEDGEVVDAWGWAPSEVETEPRDSDIASYAGAPSTTSQNQQNIPGPSSLNNSNANGNTLDEFDDEEDETVRAIVAAIKKPRTHPPDLKLDDFVTDISFHPERDLIALASINGDVLLYEYGNEENKLLKTLEVHTKSCRDVEWSEDGKYILTASKDKSIMITDIETEKLKNFYDNAHSAAIYKLYVIDENLFSTGDDDGTVKLWDVRTKDAIFSLKEVEDYISCMLTNDAKKYLVVASGDGYLTTINIGARKLYVQSEPYEEELTCMGLYRNDSKLVVGTSKGRLYTFNWNEFGYHCDMYPGVKSSISYMLPLTDRIGCVAGEEGVVRATHIAPFRNLGIVGQHNLPVEAMDINHSGEFIASSSHNNDVRFWNIKYFEDFDDIKYNEKQNQYRERQHNLPSSKYSNTSDFFADLANNLSE